MEVKNTDKIIQKFGFFLLLFFFIACTSIEKSKKNESQFLNIKDSIMIYNDNYEQIISNNLIFDSLKLKIKNELELNDVELLGEIKTKTLNWFLLKGSYNSETFQETSIYFYSFPKSSVPDSILKQKYSLPGNEYSFEKELGCKTRIFVGNCAKKYDQSVIWYQIEKNENKWDTSYYIVKFHDDTIESFMLNNDEINLYEILENVKLKNCIELEGVDTYEEP